MPTVLLGIEIFIAIKNCIGCMTILLLQSAEFQILKWYVSKKD